MVKTEQTKMVVVSEELSDFLDEKKLENVDLENYNRLIIQRVKTDKLIDQLLLKRFEKNDKTLTRQNRAYIKKMLSTNKRK